MDINFFSVRKVIMSSSRLKNVLPLQHFIRKAQVLKLYRELLRDTKALKDHSLKTSVREQVIFEFRNSMHVSNPSTIKALLAEGQRSLAKIKSMSDKIDVADRWTEESDHEDDKRGRTGNGWPWEK